MAYLEANAAPVTQGAEADRWAYHGEIVSKDRVVFYRVNERTGCIQRTFYTETDYGWEPFKEVHKKIK